MMNWVYDILKKLYKYLIKEFGQVFEGGYDVIGAQCTLAYMILKRWTLLCTEK